MAIYIGTTLISETSGEGISLGTSDINEVYVGTNMVWQRAADVDGTSGYLLTNTSVTNSGGGVSTSDNFGAWSAYSPTSVSDASQCNLQNVTVTQSRSRTHSITTTTAADYCKYVYL
jgi:hypothetical protein